MLNNKIYLPIYDFNNELKLIFLLQEYLKQNQNKIILPNSILDGVYGSFPHTIWSGGRTLNHNSPKLSIQEIENIILNLNSKQIKMNITFTNCLLEEKHLADKYCNKILAILDNGFNNEIIITSSILENYVREEYPNLNIVSSITKGHDFQTFKENIHKNYSSVVAFSIAENLDYIKTLNLIDQEKVEIILGSKCASCPISLKHYEIESFNNLNNITTMPLKCPKNENNIIIDYNVFNKLNIHKYKITGRCRGNSINYLIKHYLTILLNDNKLIDQEYNTLIDFYKKI